MHLSSRTANWLLAALTPVAFAYCAFGLYCLAFDTKMSFPMDLRLRYLEQNMLYRGLGLEVGEPTAKPVTMEEFVRGRRATAYPPWAYTTNWLFFPPLGWQATRIFYAALCALGLAVLGLWGYREGAAWGRQAGLLAAASLLAMFPLSICVSYGQYGLLVTALLIGCLALSEKGWDFAAGLCLGLALLKPNLAGLFAVGLLLRGRFLVVGTASAYMAGAIGLTWFLTGGNPLDMMRKISEEAEAYYFYSHNPLIVLLTPMIGLKQATLLLASAGLAACSALVWRFGRSRSLLTTFSICAVVSLLWCYRKHYDTALISFLFLSLLLLAFRTQSRLAAGLYLLMGLTLWAPLRLPQWNLMPVQFAFAGLWVVVLAAVIALEPSSEGAIEESAVGAAEAVGLPRRT